MNTPLVLIILDGWGYRENPNDNAIAAADTPQWDAWWKTRPHMLLEASGGCVGLPNHQMGNSEVGHMHLGAGRLVKQDYTQINEALADKTFYHNTVFLNAIRAMQQTGKTLHIMGLLSPGGVHSHEEHLFALLKLCAQEGYRGVSLHVFLDGRDTPPQSALQSLAKLNTFLKEYPVGTICSISGRYYAMDRDKRWDRTEAVYRMLVEGKSPYHFPTAPAAVEHFYAENLTDEFIPPTLIGERNTLTAGDAVLFFNFRADRARQLTEAFIADSFHGFMRVPKPNLAHFTSMTRYSKRLPTEVAFSPIVLRNTLGEVIAQHGLRQLRIAETEKYAHVTYFFNGGSEQPFPLEEHILIPSPSVTTYDKCPEMSALEVTKTLVNALETNQFDVIICNYANADMVGHTGNFEATVKAIECLDGALHTVWKAVEKQGGQLLITADHGNAEAMFDEQTQQAHTAHTCQPVPLLYISDRPLHFYREYGNLTDIAPTVLTALGITPPPEMTGNVLWAPTHVPTP